MIGDFTDGVNTWPLAVRGAADRGAGSPAAAAHAAQARLARAVYS
jgi:hypothetical protein